MEKPASEMMGEPVVIGATIASKGTLSKMALAGGVGAAGGAIGSLAASAIGSALAGKIKNPSVPGNHSGLMYIAVTPTRVGFFSVKRGLIKNSIKELLATHPREDVVGIEIGGGLIPSVGVLFNDGTNYTLEVARAQKGKMEKVKRDLGK